MAESSSLSLQSFETCGSFWLSVASTIAWPTLLAVLSIIYTRITVTYNLNRGGKIEQKTLLGVVDHRFIAPSPATMQLPTSSTRSRAIPSHYYITHSTSTRTNRSYSWCCCLTGWSTSTATSTTGLRHGTYTMDQWSYLDLRLLLGGYPIRNFSWVDTGDVTLKTGVQLIRLIIGRPVLEDEIISGSKIVISIIGFIFGLVGLLRDPSSIPRSVQSMFVAGIVPNIKVFPLANTVITVLSFLIGLIIGLISRAPSARQVAPIFSSTLVVIWFLLCLASFGVGCWQIDMRRRAKESVWPMFIYWAPAATVVKAKLCGLQPIPLLGMVGVVMGIAGENNIACR